MNLELPDVQAGFRKGRGTRDQIAKIHWIIKKAREFQKNIYFALLTLKRLSSRKKNLENLKGMGIHAPWEVCMQVRKQQWELDMEQQTGSK